MTTIEILKKAREMLSADQDLVLDQLFTVLPLEKIYFLLGYPNVSTMLSPEPYAEVLQRFDEAIARLEAAG